MLNQINRKMKEKAGFTLIELIVVIAILAILALIAIPRFTGILDSSKLKSHNANVKTIEAAVAVYVAETGTAMSAMDDITVLIPDYLDVNPADPRNADNTTGDYSITDGVVSPAYVAPTT